MIEINNRLEPTDNTKREREGAAWTEDEIRMLIQYTQAGWHVEATAFALKRNKSEVILQGLELGLLTLERADYPCSEQQYVDNFNAQTADVGKENCWNSYSPEPRTLDQIRYVENVFSDKIWFMYHLCMRHRVATGQEQVDPDIWQSALKAADEVLRKYGQEIVIPNDDFQWGAMHGKLSALRWVLGSEWDMLDL